MSNVTSRYTCWIVGCHYYNGVACVSAGQNLVLYREKGNPHDSNAIAARTQSGTILGHLSRSDAASLAPALDRGAQVAAQVVEIVAKPARILISVDLKYDGKLEVEICHRQSLLPWRFVPRIEKME